MHRHYTHYMGRKVLKSPFDWIVTQDILFETKPEVIIEIGSFDGGMALWMAHFLDSMGSDAQIIGVDITERPTAAQHPRLHWVIGDALSPEVVGQVEKLCAGKRGMVIEDSDHKYHITKGLLDAYQKFVAPGCYFLVEDTFVEFMNIPPFPGPLGAVKEFAEAHKDQYVIDRSREKYILTYNPMGYLLRLPDAPGTETAVSTDKAEKADAKKG
jgi:cephalosporin hydroxylase